MEVEYGTLQDIESWMELVQQVRWNFPGLETQEALEDHRQTVLRFMSEHRALCVKDGDKVIGVLLLSKKHNMICCLAVAPAHRRNGIASALLEQALSELDRSKDITVAGYVNVCAFRYYLEQPQYREEGLRLLNMVIQATLTDH